MSVNYQEYDYSGLGYGDPDSGEKPVTKVVFSLIICILGLVGNAVVIFVILVLKEYKKSVTHWYVLQLAIADSLFLLTLPFKVSEDLEGRWAFSQTLCKTKETILFLNYYASILFLVIMSVDRYIAVCQRFQKYLQKLRTNNSALIITAITWIVALLICIPVMMYSYKVGNDPNCSCSYEFPIETNLTRTCLNEGYNSDTIQECISFKQKIEDSRDKNEPYCTKPETIEDLFSSYYNENANVTGGEFDYSNYGSAGYGYSYYENGVENSGDSGLNITNPTEIESTTTGGVIERNISPNCHYWGRPASWTGFLIFNFVGMFILPFIIMTVCYTLIVLRLKSTRVRLQSSVSITSQTTTTGGTNGKRRRKSSSRSDKDRRRVTTMCVVLVGSFGLLWLPFHANHIAKIIGIPRIIGDDTVCQVLPVVGSILAYLNSALNPYLYSFLGTSFKRRLRLMKQSPSIRHFITMVRRKDTSVSSEATPSKYWTSKRQRMNSKDYRPGASVRDPYTKTRLQSHAKGQHPAQCEARSENDVLAPPVVPLDTQSETKMSVAATPQP